MQGKTSIIDFLLVRFWEINYLSRQPVAILLSNSNYFMN